MTQQSKMQMNMKIKFVFKVLFMLACEDRHISGCCLSLLKTEIRLCSQAILISMEYGKIMSFMNPLTPLIFLNKDS